MLSSQQCISLPKHNGGTLHIIGVAHLSPHSITAVRDTIRKQGPDYILLELDAKRAQAFKQYLPPEQSSILTAFPQEVSHPGWLPLFHLLCTSAFISNFTGLFSNLGALYGGEQQAALQEAAVLNDRAAAELEAAGAAAAAPAASPAQAAGALLTASKRSRECRVILGDRDLLLSFARAAGGLKGLTGGRLGDREEDAVLSSAAAAASSESMYRTQNIAGSMRQTLTHEQRPGEVEQGAHNSAGSHRGLQGTVQQVLEEGGNGRGGGVGRGSGNSNGSSNDSPSYLLPPASLVELEWKDLYSMLPSVVSGIVLPAHYTPPFALWWPVLKAVWRRDHLAVAEACNALLMDAQASHQPLMTSAAGKQALRLSLSMLQILREGCLQSQEQRQQLQQAFLTFLDVLSADPAWMEAPVAMKEERDRLLAAASWYSPGRCTVAVVGLAHVEGMQKVCLQLAAEEKAGRGVSRRAVADGAAAAGEGGKAALSIEQALQEGPPPYADETPEEKAARLQEERRAAVEALLQQTAEQRAAEEQQYLQLLSSPALPMAAYLQPPSSHSTGVWMGPALILGLLVMPPLWSKKWLLERVAYRRAARAARGAAAAAAAGAGGAAASTASPSLLSRVFHSASAARAAARAAPPSAPAAAAGASAAATPATPATPPAFQQRTLLERASRFLYYRRFRLAGAVAAVAVGTVVLGRVKEMSGRVKAGVAATEGLPSEAQLRRRGGGRVPASG